MRHWLQSTLGKLAVRTKIHHIKFKAEEQEEQVNIVENVVLKRYKKLEHLITEVRKTATLIPDDPSIEVLMQGVSQEMGNLTHAVYLKMCRLDEMKETASQLGDKCSKGSASTLALYGERVENSHRMLSLLSKMDVEIRKVRERVHLLHGSLTEQHKHGKHNIKDSIHDKIGNYNSVNEVTRCEVDISR